jgi:hypothetical protein
MGKSAISLLILVVMSVTLTVAASANTRAPEKHPGSCVAIFNESTVTVTVRVATPRGYSGTAWKIGRADIMANSMGETLATSRGPIVSSNGEWDITIDPANLSKSWQFLPVNTKGCNGMWSISVGVPAG